MGTFFEVLSYKVLGRRHIHNAAGTIYLIHRIKKIMDMDSCPTRSKDIPMVSQVDAGDIL